MEIEKLKSLKELNTFKVDVFSDYYVSVKNTGELKELFESSILKNEQFLVMGGGSNILFTGNFKGLIIHIDIQGLTFRPAGNDCVLVEAGSGEQWNGLVSACVHNKYYGLENLALIPGRVGAAPVQNIGAYGIEQEKAFEHLEAWDIENNKLIRLGKDECRFAYRNSIFKNELKNKAIVTSVTYRLSQKPVLNLGYKDIQQEMDKSAVTAPGLQWVFDAVCRIRQRKLPDPDVIGNAGSFFKNPYIDSQKLEAIRKTDPDMPVYPSGIDGMYKISAARLIEQCGWKGFRKGDAGVYAHHSLILVNHGNAEGSQIWELAESIMSSVREKFGIDLENEVLKV